jgi:hypothetical protein
MKTIEVTVNGKQTVYHVPKAVWAYYEACGSDRELEAAHLRAQSTDEIAALAQSHGFATTGDDIVQFLIAAESADAARVGVLTDEELDLVSGGQTSGPGGNKPRPQPCTPEQVRLYCWSGNNRAPCRCPDYDRY